MHVQNAEWVVERFLLTVNEMFRSSACKQNMGNVSIRVRIHGFGKEDKKSEQISCRELNEGRIRADDLAIDENPRFNLGPSSPWSVSRRAADSGLKILAIDWKTVLHPSTKASPQSSSIVFNDSKAILWTSVSTLTADNDLSGSLVKLSIS